MKVYTYYKDVPSLNKNGQIKLLECWSNNWADKGFDPVVMGENDAKLHPNFHAFTDRMGSFPMMNHNNPGYDMACFHRFMAMTQLGGGLMSDYDCLNNHFKPCDIVVGEMTVYCPPHVPCLVSGSALEYERIIDLFMQFDPSMYKEWLHEHSNGGTAVMDMLILANYPDHINGVPYVKEYSTKGWEKSKAIHFPSCKCGPKKLDIMNKWTQTQSTSSWPTAAPSKPSTDTFRCGNGTDFQ